MLLLALTATLLAQAPTDGGTPVLNVATTNFVGVNISADETTFFTEQFAQGLIKAGAEATSPQQFQALMAMARQRALMGECDEELLACQTEMANALGADAMATGEIAKLLNE